MFRTINARRAVVVLLGFSLIAVACGGGSEASTSQATTRASTAATTTATTGVTTTTQPSLAVTSLDEVGTAVVRIVAEGSFVDPEFGAQFNVAGSGSGFIISEDGLAVTNNHVVTGAAFLEVYVGGESEPRNARILGVSECSDLAVIDIDGGGYKYLNWFEGDMSVGTDVFTAGYPLGDPEFTLTKGIISKASADGESNWASVDSVIEHDATINPGNSGGPLVTADGEVVGINYAGIDSTGQYFAITRDEALPIIEDLSNGNDVTSLGINGQAVASDADGVYGVWVSNVDPGSPADSVGIEPGDVVTSLQGLVLGTDGTMADYCDILRSNNPGDVLSVEVLRSSTEEYYEGRINDSPLELVFSLPVEADEDVPTAATYVDYVTVTDDSGAVTVDVPAAWTDLNGLPRPDGPSIAASTSVEGFFNTWDVPGVEVYATRTMGAADIEALMDDFAASADCDSSSDRDNYEDALYAGRWQFFIDCGGTTTGLLFVASSPASGDFVVEVLVQVLTDADYEAIDRILSSFVVDENF